MKRAAQKNLPLSLAPAEGEGRVRVRAMPRMARVALCHSPLTPTLSPCYRGGEGAFFERAA